MKRTPLRKVSAKRAARWQSAEGKRDATYLQAVRRLPCCICQAFGMTQTSPTQAHHPIHERYATKKPPHTDTIPLCEGHHLGMLDVSKLAIHSAPGQWRKLYGQDVDYIEPTQKLLEEHLK